MSAIKSDIHGHLNLEALHFTIKTLINRMRLKNYTNGYKNLLDSR